MSRRAARRLALAFAALATVSSGGVCCVASAALLYTPAGGIAPPPARADAAPDRGYLPVDPERGALGCAEGRVVTRPALGARWPLTVPGGCLVCEPGRRVVFVHAGRRYAVNGAAVADLRTRPLEAIWADDPELEGMKMDVGALVGRGLNICPQQEHTRGRRRARTSAR